MDLFHQRCRVQQCNVTGVSPRKLLFSLCYTILKADNVTWMNPTGRNRVHRWSCWCHQVEWDLPVLDFYNLSALGLQRHQQTSARSHTTETLLSELWGFAINLTQNIHPLIPLPLQQRRGNRQAQNYWLRWGRPLKREHMQEYTWKGNWGRESVSWMERNLREPANTRPAFRVWPWSLGPMKYSVMELQQENYKTRPGTPPLKRMRLSYL